MKAFLGAVAIGSAILLGGVTTGQAATLSATELLQQYNLITKGDVFSGQEVEGNVYVGGNLNGGTLQHSFVAGLAATDLANLVVHGDNNAIINPTSGSTVVIGGENKGTVTGGEGARKLIVGSLPAELVADRNEVFAALDRASEDLRLLGATLAATGGLSSYVEGEQGYTFGAGVYNLSFADLSKMEFKLNLAQGESAIFNISGNPGSIQKNFLGLGDYSVASQVVWNFYEAMDITFQSKFVGAVLAPKAHLNGFSGSLEGSVYAQSASLTNGEIHYQGFNDGILPDDQQPAPVPLPAAMPLMLVGIGALTALRRRKKA